MQLSSSQQEKKDEEVMQHTTTLSYKCADLLRINSKKVK